MSGASPPATGLSSQAIEPPSGVSPVPASIPCAFDLDVRPDPRDDLDLDWILIAVDRKGEGFILDASPDFYAVDLLTELWACDNGITVPKGAAPGLYMMRDICIIGGVEDFDIEGSWKILHAIAIEARSGETGTGSTEGESAAIAPKGAA